MSSPTAPSGAPSGAPSDEPVQESDIQKETHAQVLARCDAMHRQCDEMKATMIDLNRRLDSIKSFYDSCYGPPHRRFKRRLLRAILSKVAYLISPELVRMIVTFEDLQELTGSQREDLRLILADLFPFDTSANPAALDMQLGWFECLERVAIHNGSLAEIGPYPTDDEARKLVLVDERDADSYGVVLEIGLRLRDRYFSELKVWDWISPLKLIRPPQMLRRDN